MRYDLVKHTEEFLCRERFRGHSSPAFYPSEASVKATNEFGEQEILGECLRACYFRCVGEEARPHSARSQMIFKLGKAVEDMLVEEWKKMGIFIARGIRFENRKHRIRGELDVVLREPGTNNLFGTEVKSYYGYYANKEIVGNKSQAGKPKMNQLLQALVYAHEFRSRLSYFKMFYLERGDGTRKQFDIRSVPDELENGAIIYRPELDGQIQTNFTIDGIYERYKELAEYLKAGTVPPPEFELMYNDERIERDYERGIISKTKYTDFKKKGDSARPGDWQCSYCNFRDVCWK